MTCPTCQWTVKQNLKKFLGKKHLMLLISKMHHSVKSVMYFVCLYILPHTNKYHITHSHSCEICWIYMGRWWNLPHFQHFAYMSLTFPAMLQNTFLWTLHPYDSLFVYLLRGRTYQASQANILWQWQYNLFLEWIGYTFWLVKFNWAYRKLIDVTF